MCRATLAQCWAIVKIWWANGALWFSTPKMHCATLAQCWTIVKIRWAKGALWSFTPRMH
jgi:hypothetical protein